MWLKEAGRKCANFAGKLLKSLMHRRAPLAKQLDREIVEEPADKPARIKIPPNYFHPSMWRVRM